MIWYQLLSMGFCHRYTSIVFSRSRRLRMITLSKTLIIPDIKNRTVLLYIERKKWKSCFCFFTDGKQHKARELHKITLRNHAPLSYMTWLPVTLSVLDMIIVLSATRWHQRRWLRKFTVRFRPIRKEIVNSIYDNILAELWRPQAEPHTHTGKKRKPMSWFSHGYHG